MTTAAIRAEDIRAAVRDRNDGAFRHRSLHAHPARADGRWRPDANVTTLLAGGRAVIHEPAAFTWHGTTQWQLDTSRATGPLFPDGVAERAFAHTREPNFMFVSLHGQLELAHREGRTTPVMLGIPEPYTANTVPCWMREISTRERSGPSLLVSADQLAHIETLMSPGTWHLTEITSEPYLVLVSGDEPVAAITCWRDRDLLRADR